MQEIGSGELGAVSAGLFESFVWFALIAAVLLLAFGGWKLVKLLLAIFHNG